MAAKNSISELAKRLEPYLLKAGRSSASQVMSNRIILYPDDGGEISLYPKTAAGLDAALAVATSGDLITIPPCTISGAHSVQSGLKVIGLGNTHLTGTITCNGSCILESLHIDVSGNSASAVVGVIGPPSGSNADLKQVFIEVANSGAGPAYAVQAAAGGLLELFECNCSVTGGTGSAEYYATSGSIDVYGGAALSETPCGMGD